MDSRLVTFAISWLLTILLAPVLCHEEIMDGNVTIPLTTNPTKERVWNFVEGRFDLVDPAKIKKTELQGNSDYEGLKKRRKKRASAASKLKDPKTLELAVYVDQEMWDLYVNKYGLADAEPRLRTFVGVMLNTTRSLYQHQTLYPTLDIRVERFEIWRYQPLALKGVTTGLDYVDKFCSYVRPKSSGFDHATLISGNRLQVGLDIDGIAWQDSVCTDASCTVVRGAFNTAYRHGNTLAHEMGHSMGMAHDGTGPSRSCDENCCIMAPKQTGTVWSSCSRQEYQRTLLSTDCLEDNLMVDDQEIMSGPVSYMPGQVYPDEAQCHQIVGTCFRSVPGHEGECDKQYCTRHTDSTIMTTINEFRLDGSYCGPGKVCQGGECKRLDSNRRFELTAVNGGWSDWRIKSEENCGGGECSSCLIENQESMRVDVRRCDNPYPNNGGAPCRGSQIRGNLCSGDGSEPLRCRLTRYRYQSKMDYMETTCRRQFDGLRTTGVLYEKNEVGCDFVCYNRLVNEEVPKRFPDGTSCGSSAERGRCVHGVCMYAKCRNNPNLYVASESDCS